MIMSFQECLTCKSSQMTLEAWMKHLADCHPVPLQWPSERVDHLAGEASLRPYTAITESKKKRKRDYIPRPLNSFMIFAQFMRRNILMVFNEASNSDISKQLGRIWQIVEGTVKAQYNAEANRLTKIHLREFPNYKYQPKKKLKPGQPQPQQQQHQHQPEQHLSHHHVSGATHVVRTGGQVIPLSVQTEPMDHPDGKWTHHFLTSPPPTNGPHSTTLAGLSSPPATFHSYLPSLSHDVHMESPLPILTQANDTSGSVLLHHHHHHTGLGGLISGNGGPTPVSDNGLFFSSPGGMDGPTDPGSSMMLTFGDLPNLTLNDSDLVTGASLTGGSSSICTTTAAIAGHLHQQRMEFAMKDDKGITLIPTPSSVKSEELMSLVPPSVLADDANYDEQQFGIFTDHLPNLNSWVTSGNFI